MPKMSKHSKLPYRPRKASWQAVVARQNGIEHVVVVHRSDATSMQFDEIAS